MGTKILYLDEVQVVQGWEKYAHRTLRKKKKFVTGSNSSLLSLLEYIKIGGFPRIVLTGDTTLAREYFDSIIYRDIIGR